MWFLVRLLFWLMIVFAAIFPAAQSRKGTSKMQAPAQETILDKSALEKTLRAVIDESPKTAWQFCQDNPYACLEMGGHLSRMIGTKPSAEKQQDRNQ